jgi:hypothetical protein
MSQRGLRRRPLECKTKNPVYGAIDKTQDGLAMDRVFGFAPARAIRALGLKVFKIK